MNAPALSVLVYVPQSNYQVVRPTIENLRRQTAAATLEIILLAPDVDVMKPDPDAARGFYALRVVGVGHVESRAHAMAQGVRESTAPLVAFAGNHSYPDADWASALIAAHEGPWAAVGPTELNANPASMVSWAHFLMGHGRWMFPIEPGETDLVPMTNAAFKRALLVEEKALDKGLERDGTLGEDLRRRGHRLFMTPHARILHFNISKPGSFLWFHFVVGRAFGASRASRGRWPVARRALYALLWPLFPVLHVRKMWGSIARCHSAHRLVPRVLPALVAGLVAASVGESIGYVAGMGQARREILRFESDLGAHMTRADRALLTAIHERGVTA